MPGLERPGDGGSHARHGRDGGGAARDAPAAEGGATSGGDFLDALTAVQVEDRRSLSTDELVARFAAVAPKAARARRRTPGLMRRRAMPEAQPIGDGSTEMWTFGYLIDVILTRDPWLHRADIARATGRDLRLTADHDGVLVADVVAEWAGRHGQPYTLHLTGTAGGHWSAGTDGREMDLTRLSAVGCCPAAATVAGC